MIRLNGCTYLPFTNKIPERFILIYTHFFINSVLELLFPLYILIIQWLYILYLLCLSLTKFLKELYLHTFLHRFCFIHYFFDALMYYENRWAGVRGGSSVYSDSEDSQQREANGRRPQSRVYQGLLPQLKAKQVSPFMPSPITFYSFC